MNLVKCFDVGPLSDEAQVFVSGWRGFPRPKGHTENIMKEEAKKSKKGRV